MPRILALSLALLTGPLHASAAELPPEIADCKVFRLWQFDQSAEGWLPDHNVSDFSLKDGILSFENTGGDPWIRLSEIGDLDALTYRFLGIRMRSSVDGQNQVYFTTDQSPVAGEATVVTFPVTGGEEFRFYEVDMSQLKTWKGKVNFFRIDTVNGTGEKGAKLDIDWIALYQVPARLRPGRPYAGEDEKGVFISAPVTNIGGEASGDDLTVRCGGQEQKPGAIAPRETKTVTLRPPPGSADLVVEAESGGKLLFDALLASPFEKDSMAGEIRNEKSVLTIPQIRPVNRVELASVSDGKLVPMGVFRPLAILAYRGADGVTHYLELTADSQDITTDGETALLSAQRPVNGGLARFTWLFGLPKGSSEGLMTCSMVADVPLEVLRFEAPRLLAGEHSFGSSKTHGLFPGLEYLERDEPSSAVKHIGPKLADRHVPHPYKITVPLMAVEANGGVVGMNWDPLAKWSGDRAMPCAEFESPNRSEGAKNHLMTLFAPSVPSFVAENTEFAATAFALEAFKEITLSARFFARAGERIDHVIPSYYAADRVPKAPPLPHGLDGTIDTCFKAYAGTLYSPEKNGWKSHFGIGDAHSFRPGMAAVVLGESLRKSDQSLARKCKIAPNTQLTQYIGTTLDWFSPGAGKPADDILAAQMPDGGFAYSMSDDVAKKLKDFGPMAGFEAKDLGDVGTTNSGVTVVRLSPLLDYGMRTGSRKHIEAGLKGLDKLNSFTVPRGAQVWEVHMHAPDIYAAGLAVDANLFGYHVTGDAKYLDCARFWAYTGLPFVYAWVPPIDPVPSAVLHFDQQGEGKTPVFAQPSEFYEKIERYVNPGATIPVLGTSFYFVNWFGTPVQWCGLAWANSVRRYTRLRSDPVLENVTDLVFASCAQQQTDKGFLAGTYPDSWDLIANRANTAFIVPDTILDYAYALKYEKRPYAVETAGFELGTGRACLSTYATIQEFKASRSTIETALKWYAGQDLYTCIAPAPRPSAVSVDGKPLAESADLAKAASGFYYDAANKALHVKYRPAMRSARLSVRF